MYWTIAILGGLGLGLGAFFIARNPKFWISMAKDIFLQFLPSLLKALQNRPKTDEEWKEWRYLSSLKPSEMSPKEKARYRELKKLNQEFKGK